MSTFNVQDERRLFQLIASGDTEAFRQLFELYKKTLFSSALKLTKSQYTAEEITQQVFISIWVSRVHLIKVENPGDYIFRILFNSISTYLKKASNQETILKAAMQLMKTSTNSTEETIDANEKQRILNDAIENLPPQQKAVYKLSRFEGLKNDVIATRLNISPNTVKVHLSKALETLRAHMKDISFITALMVTYTDTACF